MMRIANGMIYGGRGVIVVASKGNTFHDLLLIGCMIHSIAVITLIYYKLIGIKVLILLVLQRDINKHEGQE